MFHLAAYTASIANTANLDVAALTDDVLLIQNNHFVPGANMDLVFAAALSATLSRARLQQPTLRQITTPFIRPINRAVLPSSVPGIADMRNYPLIAFANEELAMEVTSAVAMTERFTGLVGLRPRYEAPVPTMPFLLRGTSTTAAVANAWTSIATTWQDTPKAGNYQVTGLNVQSTNAIAARLIFEDQTWRPGCMSQAAIGDIGNQMFLNGGLGVWGRFNAYRPPILQVLCNAADAVHEIYLEIGRLN